MKKVIFKGIINGKEFNDVKSYNEEMLRLMETGEPVQAESHTESVKEDEVDMLPGFSNYDEFYWEEYVTGDPEKDANLYDKWDKTLGNAYKRIRPEIMNMTDDQLQEYVNDLGDVLSCIDEDEQCLNADLKDIERDKKRIENSLKIMSLTKSWYKNMHELCKSMVESKPEVLRSSEGCECGCNGHCEDCVKCKYDKNIAEQFDYTDFFKSAYEMLGLEYSPEKAKEHEENYKRLLKEIFK